jgi:hypothetical protein
MATPRRLAAASAAFRSAMVNRKVSVSAFRSDFGRSGRPIFFGMNLSLFAVDRESLLRIVGHRGGRRDPMVLVQAQRIRYHERFVNFKPAGGYERLLTALFVSHRPQVLNPH